MTNEMRAVMPRLLLVRRASLSLSKHLAHISSYYTESDGGKGQEDSDSDNQLEMPWFSLPPTNSPSDYHKTYSPPYRIPHKTTSPRRKELSSERKKRRVTFKIQDHRHEELIKTYGKRMSGEVRLDMLGELGTESGLREYNAMIEVCVDKAKKTADKMGSLKLLYTGVRVLQRIRKQGLKPGKSSYLPLFEHVANKGLVAEFMQLVLLMDRDGVDLMEINYYEMVLWIKDGNRDEVLGLCDNVLHYQSNERPAVAGGFLLALSENDWIDEVLGLLEKVEITEVSYPECLINTFKCLGRARLQKMAEKYILALKTKGTEQDSLSDFICKYALSLMDMEHEGEIVLIFKAMHEHLGVQPSSSSYRKLIAHHCETFKVHMAIDLIQDMCKAGLDISAESFHLILHACERTSNHELVPLTHELMHTYGLKPTGETVKYAIYSFVKTKNFKAAYNLLEKMRELNIWQTAHHYNTIMAGYFRENNIPRAMAVLKEMEVAHLKPDAETYSYLIYNAKNVKAAEEYWKHMERSNIPPTKHVFTALINVFVNNGKFSKAKEIVKDQRIKDKDLIEIKSTLITALASNGRVSEASEVYKEIKEVGEVPESKAFRALLESFAMQGKLSEVFQLLNGCRNKQDWCSACSKIVLCFIEHRQISVAIDLLKQLNLTDEFAVDIVCNEIFSLICDTDTVKLEDCLALLEGMRKEISVQISRTTLDFLLSACVSRKDSQCAKLIFEEYEKEGFPLNVVTLLRIFQVFLASGDQGDAAKILQIIFRKHEKDLHVKCLIKMYCKHYQCHKIDLCV